MLYHWELSLFLCGNTTSMFHLPTLVTLPTVILANSLETQLSIGCLIPDPKNNRYNSRLFALNALQPQTFLRYFNCFIVCDNELYIITDRILLHLLLLIFRFCMIDGDPQKICLFSIEVPVANKKGAPCFISQWNINSSKCIFVQPIHMGSLACMDIRYV